MFSHEPPSSRGGSRGHMSRGHSSSHADWDYRRRDIDSEKERREDLIRIAEKDSQLAIELAKLRGVDLASIGVDMPSLLQRRAARDAAEKDRREALRAAEIGGKAREACGQIDHAVRGAERATLALQTDRDSDPLYLVRSAANRLLFLLKEVHHVASLAAESESGRDAIFSAATRLVGAAKEFLDCARFRLDFKDQLLGTLAEHVNAFMKKLVAAGWDESSWLAIVATRTSRPDHAENARSRNQGGPVQADAHARSERNQGAPVQAMPALRPTKNEGARNAMGRGTRDTDPVPTRTREPMPPGEHQTAGLQSADAAISHQSTAASATRQASELARVVESTLVPAYRRAVDALDPMAAMELARHVVGSVQLLQRLHGDARTAPEKGHEPNSGAPSIPALQRSLAIRIGPQLFKDEPVLDSVVEPDMGPDPIVYLANEAGTVVELLLVVTVIRERTGANEGMCRPLAADDRREIADLIAPWRSRPVNLAFLIRALSEDGIWQAIHDARTGSGQRLADIETASAWQAFDTGALADVGELDSATVARLVGVRDAALLDNGEHGAPDGAELDDATAMELFDKLRDASPAARGPIIRQIEGMGKLGAVCEHLPWRHVQAMHDAIEPLDRP
ncbi:MAG: hypothetical protein MJE77_35055, partial [Proteobacteria bacterium]|nr:hypothetical protein [Pseudomonadota bacterium]